jgi:exodeoxyribonuclease VII large subunit
MAKSIYSITWVNRYIKNMMTSDYLLHSISVKGEVSNCKYHQSGHIYFSLKDENSAISCVMFRSKAAGVSFKMENGQQVIVSGNIDVYEGQGTYQLYANAIKLEGDGDLNERFLKLKKELEEMGMFAPEYKKPIPKYAKRVGIVTSHTGAAIRDIEQIARRRNPYVQLILYPAIVQGEQAMSSVVSGINRLDSMDLDVIIVGRGGGSAEDLQAFNERMVAETIFNARTPIISAVGHETDTTIADFVADMRAPTPSAAAELAIYDYRQVFSQMEEYQKSLMRYLSHKIEMNRHKYDTLKFKLAQQSPENKVRNYRQVTADFETRMIDKMQGRLTATRHQLDILVEQMKRLSPLEKLQKGYGYVQLENGKGIQSVEEVKQGDRISVYASDGVIEADVVGKSKIVY